jgi:hypothetical protein
LTYSAPWEGPVVEAWRKNLIPVDDLGSVLRLRRARWLAGDYDLEQIGEAYRDPDGRYVAWNSRRWPNRHVAGLT